MKRTTISRLIPILLVLVITIVIVAAVIAVGRALFFSGGETQQDNTTQNQATSTQESLLSTDSGRAVRLTLRGPLVADENFRSMRITVSPSSRSVATYEGYLDKQIAAKSYGNSVRAYEEFVYALGRREVTKSRQVNDEQNDTRGICATGKLYEFELLENDTPVERLWTSDCRGSKGSLLANLTDLVDMFQKQVPDGKAMAAKVGLSSGDSLFTF